MNKLSFYDIDKNYINYLKKFENKVPNITYSDRNKFVAGVVLKVNDYCYFAPVSSYNKQVQTNFIIFDKERALGSLRLSYMFPAPANLLKFKDFSKEEYNYKRLLMKEIKYCNDNIDTIMKKALRVYQIGTNSNHPLSQYCSNFSLLEQKCIEYVSYQEVAASKEIPIIISIKEKIINLYKEEFPAIRYINSAGAKLLDELNIKYGQAVSIKEIKSNYIIAGRNLEMDSSTMNKRIFNNFQEIQSTINQCQIKENEIKIHEKQVLNIKNINLPEL